MIFVKNEIVFGYNTTDNIPASRVLLDGFGNGISKSILMMALLRKCHIPCRFHAVLIDKIQHERAISGMAYFLAPRNFVHSWVEVYVECKWIRVVGYMLDHVYLQNTQKCIRKAIIEDMFLDLEFARSNIMYIVLEANNSEPYRPKKAINHDYGVFDSPDNFYRKHASELGLSKIGCLDI